MGLAISEKGGICQGPQQTHSQSSSEKDMRAGPELTMAQRTKESDAKCELQRPRKSEACKDLRYATDMDGMCNVRSEGLRKALIRTTFAQGPKNHHV